MNRNRFIPLISNIPNAVPTASGMYDGELAVNIADGKLYTKSGSFIIALNEFNTEGFVSSSLQVIKLIDGYEIRPSIVSASFFAGNLLGTATSASYVRIADIDGFGEYSESIEIRLEDLENFSASLDITFATDEEVFVTASILQGNIDQKLSTASFAEFSSSYTTGSFTGSFTGSLSYNDLVQVPGGIVSSSSQITELELTKLDIDGGAANLTITGSIVLDVFDETRVIEPPLLASQYSGANIEYVAQRQGAIRAGNIIASWSGSSVTYTDVSNTDVGDTSDISFNLIRIDNDIRLRVYSMGTGTGVWSIHVLYKLFPNLL
jgi:hypothetical protein